VLTLVAPAEEGAAPSPVSAGRSLAHVAFGLACLALAAAGLRALLPLPRDTVVAAKLEGLRERAADVDTLFVGSSLVYRHVDPARFDQLTAAAGRPTRSYNLGAPGLGLLELRWLLRQVAELPTGSLRWVFLDPYALGLELPDENRESARVIAWHDPAATWDAVRLVRAADLDPDHAREVMANHLVAGFFHGGNLGALRLLIERELLGTAGSRVLRDGRELADAVRARGPAADGFLSLDAALASAADVEREQLLARRSNFQEQRRDPYRSQVAQALRAGPLDPSALSPLDQPTEDLLRDVARQVQALGARLVLFSGPRPGGDPLLHHARSLGLGVAGLDLADPGSHPGLFHADRRFDARHLDGEGARLYTEALAGAFLTQTDEDGSP
jgi:hypothetical protein